MCPDILHDKSPRKLGKVVADAYRSHQVPVIAVLQQKIEDPLPQKEEREWFALVFLHNKGPAQFEGLPEGLVKPPVHPEQTLQVETLHSVPP